MTLKLVRRIAYYYRCVFTHTLNSMKRALLILPLVLFFAACGMLTDDPTPQIAEVTTSQAHDSTNEVLVKVTFTDEVRVGKVVFSDGTHDLASFGVWGIDQEYPIPVAAWQATKEVHLYLGTDGTIVSTFKR